jgi:TolA-binding protein
MGESSFSGLAPDKADVVVRLTEDELKVARALLEDDHADYEDAREDLLVGLETAGAAQLEELQERVATLAATCEHQAQKVRDLRKNKRDLAKLQREKQAGGGGREAEARGGTEGPASTERSEDAGLGNAAGAPRSPGPKGLQPTDRMERPDDGGRAQNAGVAEALPVKDVLTQVLQVPSAPAEARGET